MQYGIAYLLDYKQVPAKYTSILGNYRSLRQLNLLNTVNIPLLRNLKTSIISLQPQQSRSFSQ